MAYQRIIDLSYPLVPGKEARRLDVRMINSDAVADVVLLPDQWYTMHYIDMVSHLGTHVEVPLHYQRDGADLARIPVETFLGEAVILDLRSLPDSSGISTEQLRNAAAKAGGIRSGDIVFGWLGWSRYYRTDRYMKNPYFSTESLRWLMDQGIKLLGVDASGIENPADPEHPAHSTIFQAGVPLIENLTALDQLSRDRVFVSALPVAICGLEAFPVRVVAME